MLFQSAYPRNVFKINVSNIYSTTAATRSLTTNCYYVTWLRHLRYEINAPLRNNAL